MKDRTARRGYDPSWPVPLEPIPCVHDRRRVVDVGIPAVRWSPRPAPRIAGTSISRTARRSPATTMCGSRRHGTCSRSPTISPPTPPTSGACVPSPPGAEARAVGAGRAADDQRVRDASISRCRLPGHLRPRRPDHGPVRLQLVSRDLPVRAGPAGELDVRRRRHREGPRCRNPARSRRDVGREDERGRRAARELQARAPAGCASHVPAGGRRPGRAAGPRGGHLRGHPRARRASSGRSRPATASSRAARTTTRSTRSRWCTTWPPAWSSASEGLEAHSSRRRALSCSAIVSSTRPE